MSKTCPEGHPAEHIEVIVPLVAGRSFRVVHRCTVPHTTQDCFEDAYRGKGYSWVENGDGSLWLRWSEPAQDVEAVAGMVRKALPDVGGSA